VFPLPRPSAWDDDVTGKHPYTIPQVTQHSTVYRSVLQLAKQTVRHLFYVNPTLDLEIRTVSATTSFSPFVRSRKTLVLIAPVGQLECSTNTRIPGDSARPPALCIPARISCPSSIHSFSLSARTFKEPCLNS
jgi:hypothetical protein